jgi:hypothetical protein
MAVCLFWAGFSFLIPNRDNPEFNPADPDSEQMIPTQAQLGSVAAAIYVFMAAYSPGMGPVPFTYSAEAFPLYIRDVGMSFATATTWVCFGSFSLIIRILTNVTLQGFNFILSLTWPALEAAFTSTGAFAWYAAWNVFGWVFAYFLLPETKNLTLEELDNVFNVGNRQHAKYYIEKLPWYANKFLRRDVPPFEPLYQFADDGGDEAYDAKNRQRSLPKEGAMSGELGTRFAA